MFRIVRYRGLLREYTTFERLLRERRSRLVGGREVGEDGDKVRKRGV
jgi:hypothetical protein